MPGDQTDHRSRILFIQHAGAPGGSNMSLLYTLKALDRNRFAPSVALVFPSPGLKSFFEAEGIPVIAAPDLSVFRHTTAGWGRFSRPRSLIELARNLLTWRKGGNEVLKLVKTVRPDLVHLNSVILAPLADALLKCHIPFVWHIRESPVRGYFGLRRSCLRRLLHRTGQRVLFISEADRKAWVQNRTGIVVRNFVDFAQFDHRKDPANLLRKLGIEQDGVPKLLYMGGLWQIKGIFVLLQALRRLAADKVPFLCLMPGSQTAEPPNSLKRRIVNSLKWFGVLTESARAQRMINQFNLQLVCRILPFESDVPSLLAASDLLVFPSTQPHFARPVIEAAAMGKPVVASRIEGVTELVKEKKTGILVPPNDSMALAEALRSLLQNSPARTRMGQAAIPWAQSAFNSATQIRKIESLYEATLLAKKVDPGIRTSV